MSDAKISALTSYSNPDPVNDVVVCEICSYSYKTYPSWAKARRTCSRVCAAKLKSIEKRGENHHMFGKHHTKEAKQKISKANKGINKWFGADNPMYGKAAWNRGLKTGIVPSSAFKKGHVSIHKGVKRPNITGENHFAWKGGTDREHRRARKTLEYRQWRTAVFERDNYTCQFCGIRGGGVLEADHIKPWAYYPILRYKITNGRTLCKPCHRQTETWGNKYRDNKGRYTKPELIGIKDG